jgi:hypothetical protein
MDSHNQSELTRLRATIATVRLEKSRRAEDLASSVTSPERRRYALRRYPLLVQELRMTAVELEKLIAVARRNEYERHRH